MDSTQNRKRIYDHRLREYVRTTGDVKLAQDLDVPRSTINDWLNGPELSPDEMYFGKGDGVPDELAAARTAAQRARIEANRKLRCDSCPEFGMVVSA